MNFMNIIASPFKWIFRLFKKKEEFPIKNQEFQENPEPVSQEPLYQEPSIPQGDKQELILSKLDTVNAKLDTIQEKLKEFERED